MSKDATGASASHFLKRLFDKIRNFFCGGENGVYADVDKDWR